MHSTGTADNSRLTLDVARRVLKRPLSAFQPPRHFGNLLGHLLDLSPLKFALFRIFMLGNGTWRGRVGH
jgi:hypothetical protein